MTVLESALYLAKRGFRVFPLKPNTKVPAITNFSGAATTDESKITSWFGNGKNYNIGISTDDLLVVDVDTKDPAKNGLETISKLNAEGKIFPPTTQQVTTTKGMHLIYQTKCPVKNSVSKLGPGLDIRGKGGYIVAMGSSLNGLKYQINKRNTVDAPEWLHEACELDRGEVAHATEVAAVTDPDRAWARGLDYLARIELVSGGSRNIEAYKAANWLKDIGVTRPDCFYLMLEHWKCEPMLEPTELNAAISSAFKYGKEAQGSASPEALFAEPIVDPNPTVQNVHPVDQLNKDYAHIVLEGKHRILHETTDSESNFKLQLLEEQTFHSRLASVMHTPGEGNAIPLTRFWMKHPRRRNYDGLVFKPEREIDDRFYNLWRGFKVTDLGEGETVTDEMKSAVAAFEEHILQNVCENNTEHFNWIMTWFAHMIQKPYEKPCTALVLRGKKGVGKNAIFETFQPMFPDHYLVSGDRRYLVSNFNGHLERLLLFVADEAFWSGDKASEGILKSLITDRRVNIEKKGKDTTTIESCHRIVILGNEKWVVPASHDERRYAIFNMGEGRKQDRTFFGNMAKNMRAGGNRYLFHRLKRMDLNAVDIGQIPTTKGLLDQKKESLDLLQQWWFDSLSQGYFAHTGGFESGEWELVVPKDGLKGAFESYCKRRGRDRYLESDSGFLDSIKSLCPNTLLTKEKGEEVKVVLPDLEETRKHWDAFIGIPEKWPIFSS